MIGPPERYPVLGKARVHAVDGTLPFHPKPPILHLQETHSPQAAKRNTETRQTLNPAKQPCSSSFSNPIFRVLAPAGLTEKYA